MIYAKPFTQIKGATRGGGGGEFSKKGEGAVMIIPLLPPPLKI